MGVGDTLTTIAERFIDPVERTGIPAEHAGIEEILDRQARVIRVLNEQLDRIEKQTCRSPPEAK
jgi:hypothetical protein